MTANTAGNGFLYRATIFFVKYIELFVYLNTFLMCLLTARMYFRADQGSPKIFLIFLSFVVFGIFYRALNRVILYTARFFCIISLKMYVRHMRRKARRAKENAWWENSGCYYGGYTENSQSRYRNTGDENVGAGIPYYDALRFFGLSKSYTMDELKAKYRAAMKKAHPDSGGSTEEAEMVNMYYNVLKKAAAA